MVFHSCKNMTVWKTYCSQHCVLSNTCIFASLTYENYPSKWFFIYYSSTFRPDSTRLLASVKFPPNVAQTQEPSLNLFAVFSPPRSQESNHSPSFARCLRTSSPRPSDRQRLTPEEGSVTKFWVH